MISVFTPVALPFSLHPYSRDDGDGCKGKRQRKSSVLARLKKRATGEREKKIEGEEKKEAELHLYAVMLRSQIYVHLQRSWNSYIMVRDTMAFMIIEITL